MSEPRLSNRKELVQRFSSLYMCVKDRFSSSQAPLNDKDFLETFFTLFHDAAACVFW